MDRQKHDPNCVCCNGMSMDDLRKWEAEKMSKSGFFMHYVPYNEEGYVSSHTHGVKKSWNHPDFEIVIPVGPETANSIMWELVNRVKKGETFEAGKKYDRVIKGFEVGFAWAVEDGRDVLRVILPDKNGLFPEDDGVDPNYGLQDKIELRVHNAEDN